MNQRMELSQRAAERMERMERWLEDHEARLEKLEGRPVLDSADKAQVFFTLASRLHALADGARDEHRDEAASAFNHAADLVLAATYETLMETVLTEAFAVEQGDDVGAHPTY